MANLIIHHEGEKHEIESNEGETILEAGLRLGIDLPYSCMSGVCTACLAQKSLGEVKMDGAEAIDEDEISQGKILTCCAVPITETVELSYEEI